MPIRARVQRLVRLVAAWWRPSTHRPLQSPVSQPGPTHTRPSRPRVTSTRPTPSPPAQGGGEPLIGGAVTLRMWVVAGRLVLATSEAEAERALATLVGELAPDEQPAARAVLDAVRGGLAAAA